MAEARRPIVVVHISDLHLGPSLLKTQDSDLDREALIALDRKLNELDWDILVISGDLTSDADEESFSNVKDWLHGHRNLPGGVVIGLNLAARSDRRVVVVPGNRDRRRSGGRQQDLGDYNAFFGEAQPRLHSATRLDVRGFPISILALDSSGQGLKLSAGFVDLSLLNGLALEPSVFNIAVLHHHLFPTSNREATASSREAVRNSRELMSYLVARHTDAVLTGHAHQTDLAMPPCSWIMYDRRKRRGMGRRLRGAIAKFLALFKGKEMGPYKRATCKNGHYPSIDAYFEFLYLRDVMQASHALGPYEFATPREFHQHIKSLRSSYQDKKTELRRQRCILSTAPSGTDALEPKGFNVISLEPLSRSDISVTLAVYCYNQGEFKLHKELAPRVLTRKTDLALDEPHEPKRPPAPPNEPVPPRRPTTRSTRNPQPTASLERPRMNILHLTDLHFGLVTRQWASSHYWNSSESTEGQWREQERRGLLDTLVRDLPKISGRPPDMRQVDLVVVSGDILDRAQPAGVPLAKQFFQSLQLQLGLPSDCIVLVPGNHDVERSPSADKYGLFAEVWNSVHDKPHMRIDSRSFANKSVHRFWYPSLETEILAFNSCVGLDAGRTEEHGSIGRVQLECAERLLRDNGVRARYRIAVMHHHLVRPEGMMPRQDISEIEDSQAVIRWLAQNQFHLVLHGHQHVDWQEERLINGWGMAIVAGASAGVGKYGREAWTLPLGYQLVAMKGDTIGKRIRRQYSAQHGEWVSAAGDELPALRFGAFLTKDGTSHPQNRVKRDVPLSDAPTLKNPIAKPVAATLVTNSLVRSVLMELFPHKDQLDTFMVDNFRDTAVQFNPNTSSYDELMNHMLRRTQPLQIWEVLTQNSKYKKLIQGSIRIQQVLNQLEEPEEGEDR